jgi:hypothetical protein
MKDMIAYCGLTCDTCPIHQATIETVEARKREIRESVVRQCAEIYGMELRVEEVTDCDGCRAETGRLFSGCRNCEIRKCAIVKGLDNCACCDLYACDLLERHFKNDPGSQKTLERLRGEA